ncbi:hypothetical protein [Actinomadura keratinilytica]|uniref:Uncharacterized protein n=1 Tax=Actinomadura keratinilytica TaxID=547461 RepID=A0ABP7YYI6_9ACTN
MATRSSQPAPTSTVSPAAIGAATAAPTSPANDTRALAVTRATRSGSTCGVAAARSTPNALDSTSTPNAAGR